MNLLKESGLFMHIRFAAPYRVDFQSKDIPDAKVTELWAPLVRWHKFVAKIDGTNVAFGRAPDPRRLRLFKARAANKNIDYDESYWRHAGVPYGWESFYLAVDTRVSKVPEVAEFEWPGMGRFVNPEDAAKLAAEAIRFAKVCGEDNAVNKALVKSQIENDVTHVRIKLATPHKVSMGDPRWVGSSIEELLMPCSTSAMIIARIDGVERGLGRGSLHLSARSGQI